MTKLHAEGSCRWSYAASGGLHGVGRSAVNALSARLDVEVDRGGHTHAVSFRRLHPGAFKADGPEAAFDASSGLLKPSGSPRPAPARACATGPTARSSSRTPSSPGRTCTSAPATLVFLVPGLTIVVRDEYGLGEGGSRRGVLPLRRRHQ